MATSDYTLKDSTVNNVLNDIRSSHEEFYIYILKHNNPNVESEWDLEDDETGDVQHKIFNNLVDILDLKPFSRFVKVRVAGESNKEINKRYEQYIHEKIEMSQVVRVVETL